ncbi:hypothetical protein [Buchnera aphidicola]|uniref:DNA mismatch repair protein S5 domain-containing protein n=1 Tax=Buchnera aphidicola subsp. Melaphis rhois TaxID=118103 RepID=A0A4D6Y1N6_BUCMH|nr:hypothetical protein D9V73_02700 [Buchnera aphidicola (Melaphis rhois)]
MDGYIHINDIKNKRIQYCYVNYRIVYNNVIRHSILEAVKDILVICVVSYILYFNITPNALDINVPS